LISAGRRYAVGTKGWASFEGGWAWALKDWIDRAFMDKYGSGLPFERMQVGWRGEDAVLAVALTMFDCVRS
jgi:hypothetical protein